MFAGLLFTAALLLGGSQAFSRRNYPSSKHHRAHDPYGKINVNDYVVYDQEEVAGKSFDYIIAGGGLTGLTVANSLTKNPDISVLVIESGFWESDRGPDIYDLTHYGLVFESTIDHKYMTEIQRAHGRQEIVHSGKGLGGSTLINGGTWTRPDKAQVDAWESVFGNPGWNWAELLPYMNKAENTREPTKKQMTAGMMPIDWSCHGKKGPVEVGPRDNGSDFSPMMNALMNSVSAENVKTQVDLSCGHPVGVSMFPNSVTQEPEQYRADAGRSMLQSIIERPNLVVLVGQDVGKVLFDTDSSTPYAYGVEFGIHQSRTFTAYANREVLLAGGSSVSPLILQQSGIGVIKILKEAGIKPLVDLPVGLNQQDQTTTGTRASINKHGAGQGQAAYFATFNETFGPDADRAYELLLDDDVLESYADKVIEFGGFHNKTALLIQYRNYVEQITKDNVAYSEIFFDTYGRMLFDLWNLLPFSRGFIHPVTSDPYLRDVKNDPKYFELELDVLGQAAATRLSRRLMTLGEMNDYFERETTPGYDAVPEDASLDDWVVWAKANFRANYHSVGTCSMMTRELGGVVNHKAQVYGTKGLRVVDGSIVPTQVSSHVMSVFYGMALKIADDILDDYKKSGAAGGRVETLSASLTSSPSSLSSSARQSVLGLYNKLIHWDL